MAELNTLVISYNSRYDYAYVYCRLTVSQKLVWQNHNQIRHRYGTSILGVLMYIMPNLGSDLVEPPSGRT